MAIRAKQDIPSLKRLAEQKTTFDIETFRPRVPPRPVVLPPVKWSKPSLTAKRSELNKRAAAATRLRIIHGGQELATEVEFPWSLRGHAVDFPYTGKASRWTAPQDGVYLVGAHGASGADVTHLWLVGGWEESSKGVWGGRRAGGGGEGRGENRGEAEQGEMEGQG